jgi:hypothetical protein
MYWLMYSFARKTKRRIISPHPAIPPITQRPSRLPRKTQNNTRENNSTKQNHLLRTPIMLIVVAVIIFVNACRDLVTGHDVNKSRGIILI